MSFPKPEVGLVISYSYLWRDEAEAGHVEGRKARPCAIVLAVQEDGHSPPRVTVAPITHSRPRDPSVAVEIPAAVRKHLGLDDDPCWVILDDFNQFGWPGFDLRATGKSRDSYAYGLLPPRLHAEIARTFAQCRRRRGISVTSRDDENT